MHFQITIEIAPNWTGSKKMTRKWKIMIFEKT